MSSDESPLFSREEVLGGLPAQRASTLLFAIESRTAYLGARSKRGMARFTTERMAEEQDRAFLDARVEGRDLPILPRIQDLEHHAAHWAPLVPADAGLRAVVAHAIGAIDSIAALCSATFLLPRARANSKCGHTRSRRKGFQRRCRLGSRYRQTVQRRSFNWKKRTAKRYCL